MLSCIVLVGKVPAGGPVTGKEWFSVTPNMYRQSTKHLIWIFVYCVICTKKIGLFTNCMQLQGFSVDLIHSLGSYPDHEKKPLLWPGYEANIFVDIKVCNTSNI